MQMVREEVAEVSYCYYLRDSREIVWKFPCLEAAKFTDRDRTFWDVLPAAPRRRFQTLHPAKGYVFKRCWKVSYVFSLSVSVCLSVSFSLCLSVSIWQLANCKGFQGVEHLIKNAQLVLCAHAWVHSFLHALCVSL